MTAVILAEGISKELSGKQILRDVSLAVNPGSAFGLLGPNGAGKTTTVRVLTGLLAPESGRVSLFGQELERLPVTDYLPRIGVQTDTQLYGNLTVRQNLVIWGELFEVPNAELNRRIADLLSLFKLADRADSAVNALSKGMRQKLAVARALINRPEILFLDEPTAGLDPEAATELTGYLKNLLESGDTTVVICTHQLLGLEKLCDSIGILDGGVLRAKGSVSELISGRWPGDEFRLVLNLGASGRSALEAKNLLEGQLGSGSVRHSEGGSFELVLAAELNIHELVARLVTEGFAIAELSPISHSIQDLYFDTLAGGK